MSESNSAMSISDSITTLLLLLLARHGTRAEEPDLPSLTPEMLYDTDALS